MRVEQIGPPKVEKLSQKTFGVIVKRQQPTIQIQQQGYSGSNVDIKVTDGSK